MKLLLTASGITNTELEQAFLDLTNHKAKLRVAIVPTAGDPIEWVPEAPGSKKHVAKLLPQQSKLEDNKAYLDYKSKGHDVVLADLKQDPDKLKSTLQNVDVIDVGGGDINYLLHWTKKSKLDTYLKDILEKDVLYVGTSAGSMLPQPDIGLTWWDPVTWDEEDHTGLGIVNFLASGNHGVANDDESAINDLVQKVTERRDFMRSHMAYPWKIYLYMDGQAIKVDGDTTKHIGPGVRKSV